MFQRRVHHQVFTIQILQMDRPNQSRETLRFLQKREILVPSSMVTRDTVQNQPTTQVNMTVILLLLVLTLTQISPWEISTSLCQRKDLHQAFTTQTWLMDKPNQSKETSKSLQKRETLELSSMAIKDTEQKLPTIQALTPVTSPPSVLILTPTLPWATSTNSLQRRAHHQVSTIQTIILPPLNPWESI